MPLEQSEPYHHSDRGERPHALLSNNELDLQIQHLVSMDDEKRERSTYHRWDDEESKWIDTRSSDLLNELIREHYIREQENKIEPTEGASWFNESQQPVDPEFQDFHMSEDVFEQAWGIAKDVYFGDKDAGGLMTARRGSTLGLPSNQFGSQTTKFPETPYDFGNTFSGGTGEVGMSRRGVDGEREKWFGTNLSELGRMANRKNIPHDQLDDWFTDALSEIETHEGVHVAQDPILQEASREEEQRRRADAKARGVKVIGNDSRRSPLDVLTGREVKRERDFAVSDDQRDEWDETGAFMSQLGTSKKNWDGQPATMNVPEGMSDLEMTNRAFDRGYKHIIEERERRKNLSPSEYHTYSPHGEFMYYERREGIERESPREKILRQMREMQEGKKKKRGVLDRIRGFVLNE